MRYIDIDPETQNDIRGALDGVAAFSGQPRRTSYKRLEIGASNAQLIDALKRAGAKIFLKSLTEWRDLPLGCEASVYNINSANHAIAEMERWHIAQARWRGFILSRFGTREGFRVPPTDFPEDVPGQVLEQVLLTARRIGRGSGEESWRQGWDSHGYHGLNARGITQAWRDSRSTAVVCRALELCMMPVRGLKPKDQLRVMEMMKALGAKDGRWLRPVELMRPKTLARLARLPWWAWRFAIRFTMEEAKKYGMTDEFFDDRDKLIQPQIPPSLIPWARIAAVVKELSGLGERGVMIKSAMLLGSFDEDARIGGFFKIMRLVDDPDSMSATIGEMTYGAHRQAWLSRLIERYLAAPKLVRFNFMHEQLQRMWLNHQPTTMCDYLLVNMTVLGFTPKELIEMRNDGYCPFTKKECHMVVQANAIDVASAAIYLIRQTEIRLYQSGELVADAHHYGSVLEDRAADDHQAFEWIFRSLMDPARHQQIARPRTITFEGREYEYRLSSRLDEIRGEDLTDGLRTGVNRAFENAMERSKTQLELQMLESDDAIQTLPSWLDLGELNRLIVEHGFINHLNTERKLALEGKVMNHCVAGYKWHVESGTSWIFSLRDVACNRSTIEVRNVRDGRPCVVQNCSHGNSRPSPICEGIAEALVFWIASSREKAKDFRLEQAHVA